MVFCPIKMSEEWCKSLRQVSRLFQDTLNCFFSHFLVWRVLEWQLVCTLGRIYSTRRTLLLLDCAHHLLLVEVSKRNCSVTSLFILYLSFPPSRSPQVSHACSLSLFKKGSAPQISPYTVRAEKQVVVGFQVHQSDY